MMNVGSIWPFSRHTPRTHAVNVHRSASGVSAVDRASNPSVIVPLIAGS